jgi:SAM-dependent methyltransferase
MKSKIPLSAYGHEGVEELRRFNKITFKNYCNKKLSSVNKHIHFIRKNKPQKYKGKVLEIGSGSGKLLFSMEKNNLISEGVGCEVSKSRSKFSNKFKKEFGIKKVKIENKNFLDLKFKKNYFDLVIGIDCVINYIGSNPKHLQKFLNNCEKALKKGGYLILEFMTFEREKKMIKQSLKKKYFTWKKLSKEDPFLFGLDKISYDSKGLIVYDKFFLERNRKLKENNISHRREKLVSLSKAYFKKKKFKIFNYWKKNDDTSDQEFIALLKKR